MKEGQCGLAAAVCLVFKRAERLATATPAFVGTTPAIFPIRKKRPVQRAKNSGAPVALSGYKEAGRSGGGPVSPASITRGGTRYGSEPSVVDPRQITKAKLRG